VVTTSHTLYTEDCLKTLDRPEVNFEYVFTSPPDFSELNLDVDTGLDEYMEFIDSVFSKLTQKCSLITIVNTDRKYNGGIMPKHILFHDIMRQKNFRILYHKIWCKSLDASINIFRLGYAHVVTYAKEGLIIPQNNFKLFKPDVYFSRCPKYRGYSFGNSELIAEFHIRHFMKKGMVLYDPFCGSGTNLSMAKKFGFSSIGSEISESVALLCTSRLDSVVFPLLRELEG